MVEAFEPVVRADISTEIFTEKLKYFMCLIFTRIVRGYRLHRYRGWKGHSRKIISTFINQITNNTYDDASNMSDWPIYVMYLLVCII